MSDYNKRLILLSVIQLSDGYCINFKKISWQLTSSFFACFFHISIVFFSPTEFFFQTQALPCNWWFSRASTPTRRNYLAVFLPSSNSLETVCSCPFHSQPFQRREQLFRVNSIGHSDERESSKDRGVESYFNVSSEVCCYKDTSITSLSWFIRYSDEATRRQLMIHIQTNLK